MSDDDERKVARELVTFEAWKRVVDEIVQHGRGMLRNIDLSPDIAADYALALDALEAALKREGEARQCGATDCREPAIGGWLCKQHGCHLCGYVILADTEDDPVRLCADCVERRDRARALGAMLFKRFPVMDGPSVPWHVMLPHERQAQENHEQSLERLAQRGGLGPDEAWAVVNGLRLRDIPRTKDGQADWHAKWADFAKRVNRELVAEAALAEGRREVLEALGGISETHARRVLRESGAMSAFVSPYGLRNLCGRLARFLDERFSGGGG